MHQTKKPKIWRWILILLVIFIGYFFFFGKNFSYQKTITIKEWDTFQNFLSDFSWKQKTQIKRYVRHNDVDLSKLQMGSYMFSGTYTPKTFVETILEGPRVAYHTIRVLEWWSIYDIDNSLASKWLITSGSYISFVSDPTIIAKYQTKYPFIQNIALKSLEWFLYPDTYKVDIEKDVIDQLVYLQLETFKKRVWEQASTLTPPQWLDWFKTIILASIVEKEERSSKNRPTVAGILLKRLQLGTLVGADISLCYFFKMPYSECKPSFIATKVAETNNPYNTRAVKGLPPTPVSNPTAESIMAVLKPNQTEYFFYLHDNQWQIHYAISLEEHNQNKKNYLQ